MSKPNFTAISIIAILAGAGMLSGCGGTKVLKEPRPIQATQPLAAASDQRVTATLDWVVVRDGPGTWAKNADWDEYLLRVGNASGQPIQVLSVTVIDSLDTRIGALADRKQLVRGSRQTARRYKDSGIEVKAGGGAATIVAAGAAVTVIGTGAAYAAAWGAAGGTAAAASGLLLLGPAMVVGGFARGVRNSAVNGEIEERQTTLPLVVPAGGESVLDVFFPIAPSPGMVHVVYTDATGENHLYIDTGTALHGLHIDTAR